MKTLVKLSAIAAVAAMLTACGGGGGGGSSIANTPAGSYDQHGNLLGKEDPIRTQSGLNADVRAAQSLGWSGKGVGIVIVDNFDASSTHGNRVTSIINANASGSHRDDLIRTYNYRNNQWVGTSATGDEKVLNYSLGVLNLVDSSRTCPTPTTCSFNNTTTITPNSNDYAFADSLVTGAQKLTNAVVVKAAGNEGNNAQLDVSNVKLNTAVGDRLLIVGALNKDGTTSSKADLAYYSNKAGTMSSKFVVANGCLGETCSLVNGSFGTSYAAPRVSSYAAIIQHKFQGLSAQNTAQIILNTARKDTINNYDVTIHGQGEASLSRALAPTGRLK